MICDQSLFFSFLRLPQLLENPSVRHAIWRIEHLNLMDGFEISVPVELPDDSWNLFIRWNDTNLPSVVIAVKERMRSSRGKCGRKKYEREMEEKQWFHVGHAGLRLTDVHENSPARRDSRLFPTSSRAHALHLCPRDSPEFVGSPTVPSVGRCEFSFLFSRWNAISTFV